MNTYVIRPAARVADHTAAGVEVVAALAAAFPPSEEGANSPKLIVGRLVAGAGAVGLTIVAIALIVTAQVVALAMPALAIVDLLL